MRDDFKRRCSCIIPDNKILANDSNIFSDDDEYKLNFFLNFRSDFITDRYKHEISQRKQQIMKGYIHFSILLWIVGYSLYKSVTFTYFAIGLLSCIAALDLLIKKYNLFYVRGCFFYIEYIYYSLSLNDSNSIPIFLPILFNIQTVFLSNITYIYRFIVCCNMV